MKGFSKNALCPKCNKYTKQQVVKRGVRKCLDCSTEFRLKDTELKWAWPRKA